MVVVVVVRQTAAQTTEYSSQMSGESRVTADVESVPAVGDGIAAQPAAACALCRVRCVELEVSGELTNSKPAG